MITPLAQELKQWKSRFRGGRPGQQLFVCVIFINHTCGFYQFIHVQISFYLYYRWREEGESEALRHQEKVQQVEREKMDAVLALKKKIDTLEVSKTNEISRLQDIHR